MKHTPGPWAFFRIDETDDAWRACEIWEVNESGEQGKAVATFVVNDDDARRIVACVNACEGISVETIENPMLKNAIKAKAAFVETIEQRDELLAALDMIATSCEIDTLTAAIECAKNAIAKIEASK